MACMGLSNLICLASRAKKEHFPLHAHPCGTRIQFRGQAFMQLCIALGVQYGLSLHSHCIGDLASDPLLVVSSTKFVSRSSLLSFPFTSISMHIISNPLSPSSVHLQLFYIWSSSNCIGDLA
jgi:hypothetical protein